MTSNPVVISADAEACEAEGLMKTYRVSGLPVVSEDVTVGVINQTDLVLGQAR